MLSIIHLFEDAKPDLAPGEYAVLSNPKKVRDLNLKTGRMKNFKRRAWIKTKIPPEKRSFKNIPKYSTGKNRVRFQDWLEIKGQPLSSSSTVNSWGWAANGKCYGWSHRAVAGFEIGQEITNKICGQQRIKKPFTIKTEKQCEEVARKFAEDVS
jgi:hypothetical protein